MYQKIYVSSEVRELVTRVRNAFSNIVLGHCSLVVLFNETFKERAQKPGFLEREGLATTLTRLFWRYLPDRYFDLSRYQNYSTVTGSITKEQLSVMINELSNAIETIAEQDPSALIYLERHRQKKGVPLSELLMALLAFYVDDKSDMVEALPL